MPPTHFGYQVKEEEYVLFLPVIILVASIIAGSNIFLPSCIWQLRFSLIHILLVLQNSKMRNTG